MGIDVDSVIFVGKHTKDPSEYFTEEQLEGFDGDWQDHGMDSELEVHPVSGYADYGYWVGFEITSGTPHSIAILVKEAAEQFEEITGEKAEFTHWAYYW